MDDEPEPGQLKLTDLKVVQAVPKFEGRNYLKPGKPKGDKKGTTAAKSKATPKPPLSGSIISISIDIC